jgi:hypothetical protein
MVQRKPASRPIQFQNGRLGDTDIPLTVEMKNGSKIQAVKLLLPGTYTSDLTLFTDNHTDKLITTYDDYCKKLGSIKLMARTDTEKPWE